MNQLPSEQTMWRAFAAKDATYDGLFYVAVRTTGVFCRPTCRARLPRRENVEFFARAEQAERAGYRPCKLCRPNETAAPPEVVRRLVEMARDGEGGAVRGRDLAASGIDPSTARRQFRRHFGVTFAAYQRAARMGEALRGVRQGEAVVAAQVGAGYASASGFRRAFTGQFGVPASRAAAADVPPPLFSARFETPLGAMVGVACDDGVVVLDFHDRRGLAGALERVRKRFGRSGAPASIVPGDNEHLSLAGLELASYFAGKLREFSLKVASSGSTFEREAWAYLRAIPYGQTRTYGRQAGEIGRPAAVRAVGRANGMNYVSIVIPCHRVVGADGALTGYGGGLWRKKWLLEHERRVLGDPSAETLWEARAGA